MAGRRRGTRRRPANPDSLTLSERVSVEAVDDGVGFVPSQALCGSGLGLIGMTERSKMLGGKLVIDSSPGCGTTIRLYVPLAAVS